MPISTSKMNNQYFWDPNQTHFTPNYDSGFNQSLAFQSSKMFEPEETGALLQPVDYINSEFDEEPPLLEELEIYPDQIMQKIVVVLNPFKSHGLTDDAEYLIKDPDLAGPIFFYLLLGASIFLSGGETPFGYIYIFSVFSSAMMYGLLSLMAAPNLFNVKTVASILGYGLIPINVLSLVGIFITLRTGFGVVLAVFAVIWSSISTSKFFVAVSRDKDQQPLIAYPCALVSTLYVLMVVFS